MTSAVSQEINFLAVDIATNVIPDGLPSQGFQSLANSLSHLQDDYYVCLLPKKQ